MTNPILKRRDFLAASAASLFFLSAGRSASAKTTGFRFITPFTYSLSFAPVLYASAAGYYDDAGLTVEVQAANGAAMAAQMVLAGQMDSGRTGGTNYLISRVNHGAPLISIATIAQLSPFYIISSIKNPVKNVADLVGRTVGMASLGGSMEGTLNLMMRKGNLATDKVNKVKVADSAASFALIEAGRAGAFIGNTSSMVKAKAVRKDVFAIPMDDGMPGQVYVAQEKDISANPDKYVAFLKATHRSALEIATAKDLQPIIKAIMAKYTMPGLNDMKTAELNLSENARGWVAKGNDNLLRNIPELWAAAVTTLHDAGMINSAPDPKTLYTNDLLDKAIR